MKRLSIIACATLTACAGTAPQLLPSPVGARPPKPRVIASASAVPPAPARQNLATATVDGDEVHEGPGASLDLDHGEPDGPSLTKRGDFFVHPLAGLSDEELERRVLFSLGSLGSISLGATNSGRLINGVPMAPDGVRYRLVSPQQAWGTEETIHFLTTAIDAVWERYPDSPPLSIGHISGEHGGPLSPHRSHQAGRDVDISYYYLDGSTWYRRATEQNLDVARTWEFIKALVLRTDIHLILMDTSVQKLVKRHALAAGEAEPWVEAVFGRAPGRMLPIVMHVAGHDNHLHLRFYNRVAQESGRRIYPILVKHGLIPKVTATGSYRVRRGDTLGAIARRFRTTVGSLRAMNGGRRMQLRAGQTLRVPRIGGTNAAEVPGPVIVPPRLLPPTSR